MLFLSILIIFIVYITSNNIPTVAIGTVKLSVPFIDTASKTVSTTDISIALKNQFGIEQYAKNPDTIINVVAHIAKEPANVLVVVKILYDGLFILLPTIAAKASAYPITATPANPINGPQTSLYVFNGPNNTTDNISNVSA